MTLREIGKQFLVMLGVVLTGVTIYEFGYSKGRGEIQTLIEVYKLRQEDSEKTSRVAQQEITSLKLELQRAIELPRVRESTLPNVKFVEGALAVNGSKQGVSVSLEAGQTKSPFDGDLYVSLISISYIGSPPSHVATLVVGRTGKPSLRLEDVTVGSVAEYEGYEIRLVATGTFSIGVQVNRV